MASPQRFVENIDADAISEIIKQEFSNGIRDVHLLVAGKCGTGKTSLADALLTNESGGGSFGPLPGTQELVRSKKSKIQRIPTFIHDIRGLYDGNVLSSTIMEAIKQKCPVDSLNTVILCFRWDDRLDEANQNVFCRLNELDPNIWKNTIFALTFCDHLPPELSSKTNDEKRDEVSRILSDWKIAIQQQLKHLNVPDDIVRNIKVCPTTHTEEIIDYGCFSPILQQKSWLKNLWDNLVENAKHFPEICRHVISLAAAAASCQESQGEDKKPGVVAYIDALLGGAVGATLGAAAGIIADVDVKECADVGAAVGIAFASAGGITLVATLSGLTLTTGVAVGVVVGAIGVTALAGLAMYLYYTHNKRKCD